MITLSRALTRHHSTHLTSTLSTIHHLQSSPFSTSPQISTPPPAQTQTLTQPSQTRLQALRQKLITDTTTNDLPDIQVLKNFASQTNAAAMCGITLDSDDDESNIGVDGLPSKNVPPVINPIRKKAKKSKRALPKPPWLRLKQSPDSASYQNLRTTVRSYGLATVCEEARCPNIGECWGGRGKNGTDAKEGQVHRSTATIMIMGDTCTRGCSFCSVKTSRKPAALDVNEPLNVGRAVNGWGLGYIVITSVDRDDLTDQGAAHTVKVIQEIKKQTPTIYLEALTGDFRGDFGHIKDVANAGVDVYAHNIETVDRLQRRVRDHRAGYEQSLSVLRYAKQCNSKLITKTSIMLGLGEEDSEILQTLKDLRLNNVDVVTFGQYLQPTLRHMPVKAYVHPDKFEEWKGVAEGMGFKYVASGPLVRSSYRAGEFFVENLIREQKKAEEEEEGKGKRVSIGGV